MNSRQVVSRYLQAAATGGGLLLAAAIGILDYLVGPGILLGLFYLVPISLAAWFGGKRSGLLVSGLSTAAWIVANVLPARHSHPAIAAWNAAWGLGFFLVVSLLVSKLRPSWRRNSEFPPTVYRLFYIVHSIRDVLLTTSLLSHALVPRSCVSFIDATTNCTERAISAHHEFYPNMASTGKPKLKHYRKCQDG